MPLVVQDQLLSGTKCYRRTKETVSDNGHSMKFKDNPTKLMGIVKKIKKERIVVTNVLLSVMLI